MEQETRRGTKLARSLNPLPEASFADGLVTESELHLKKDSSDGRGLEDLSGLCMRPNERKGKCLWRWKEEARKYKGRC